MTDSLGSGPPPPLDPPPPAGQPAANPGYRQRPWWSEIDVLLAIVWFVFAMLIAGIVTGIAATIGGDDLTSSPVYALFFGTLSFQILQATYPWLVSRRKGLGIDIDWKFTSSLPSDIGIGFAMAVGCFIASQVMVIGVSQLVGLENSDDASNTDILTDNKGSIWIIGIVLLVVVGAPLAEELLFRGLILRVLQKSFGSVFAIIASSLLFAIPHWQPNATWQETMVLLSALGTVGLVLAIGAVKTDRLGPSVIAHFFFNGASTIAAFAA
jgi:membrane protease YdiL (CAAX protease family)